MRILILLTALAAVVALAAPASSMSDTTAAKLSTPTAKYCRFGRGFFLYAFTIAWPPDIVSARP
jgi:hypothetical protein